jgi:hypothetical protein
MPKEQFTPYSHISSTELTYSIIGSNVLHYRNLLIKLMTFNSWELIVLLAYMRDLWVHFNTTCS